MEREPLESQEGRESVSLQLQGTAHELVPQDLQNVSVAKVCTTYTKENMLKEG